MPPQEFAHWKQKTLLGVSLKVIAPTGQYYGTKLINWSALAATTKMSRLPGNTPGSGDQTENRMLGKTNVNCCNQGYYIH